MFWDIAQIRTNLILGFFRNVRAPTGPWGPRELSSGGGLQENFRSKQDLLPHGHSVLFILIDGSNVLNEQMKIMCLIYHPNENNL